MTRKEFIKFIESIGFIDEDYDIIYNYKGFKLLLSYAGHYTFYNGSEWKYRIPLNDLTPLLKIIRSIKLKALLKLI